MKRSVPREQSGPLRLAFLCSSLESGRDGVGDYSRRLAGELIRQGHPSIVAALNDPHVSQMVSESQSIEGTVVPVLRLPATEPWAARMPRVGEWLNAFNPDWLSLQFVPFGFHPRGFCFGLGKSMANLNLRASWHLMFHELWLGLGKDSTVQHRVWGALQRRIVRDLISRLQPRLVHTQAEPYRKVLSREKVESSLLPLFGNIPRVRGDAWKDLLEPLVREEMGAHPDRAKVYLAGVLGMVHPEWSAEQAVNSLLPLLRRFQKQLVLVFLGKNNLTLEAIKRLKSTLKNRANIVVTGERSSADISRILQTLDLGLATTPRQMIQKSGSVAAMLEHGLPVLVTRDDWQLRGSDAPHQPPAPRLLSPEQFALLTTLPARDERTSPEHSVRQIAGQFLESITHHSK